MTTVYWDKQRNGMGFWYRNYVEELLVCIRGHVPAFGSQLPNIVHCPPVKKVDSQGIEHSAKPPVFRRLIEESTGMATSGRNVELFARERVPGWAAMGHDVSGGRDIRADILDYLQGAR